MRTFVLLLDVEQLARGLQQLVMMLLPHLQPHTQVARVRVRLNPNPKLTLS